MTLSHLELTSMLDSLGSTLTSNTIASFFTRSNKDPQTGELTIEEAIQCLETELGRPRSEKKRIDQDGEGTSVVATPILMASDGMGNLVKLEELDFPGPGRVGRHPAEGGDKIPAPENAATKPLRQPVSEVAGGSQMADSSDTSEDADQEDGEGAVSANGGGAAVGEQERKKKKLRFRKKKSAKKLPASSQGDSESSGEKSNGEVDSVERVINVKSCPLRH